MLWALGHGRAAVRPDDQKSAFGNVIKLLYFDGQKDWPDRKSYESRGIAKPRTLHATSFVLFDFSLANDLSETHSDTVVFLSSTYGRTVMKNNKDLFLIAANDWSETHSDTVAFPSATDGRTVIKNSKHLFLIAAND